MRVDGGSGNHCLLKFAGRVARAVAAVALCAEGSTSWRRKPDLRVAGFGALVEMQEVKRLDS